MRNEESPCLSLMTLAQIGSDFKGAAWRLDDLFAVERSANRGEQGNKGGRSVATVRIVEAFSRKRSKTHVLLRKIGSRDDGVNQFQKYSPFRPSSLPSSLLVIEIERRDRPREEACLQFHFINY